MSKKRKLTVSQKRAQELKKAESDKKKLQIIAVSVVIAIMIIIGGAMIFDNIKSKRDTSTINYSIGLDKEGRIKGVNASKYVEPLDLSTISFSYEEFYPSDEDVDAYIESVIASHPDYSTEKDIAVNKGDRINIDFVGYINDVEYEGGNTGEAGISIKLGSSGYPAEFEEQIYGHKTGETFDINVSFADDFGNATLAGQDVRYHVTINGLYTSPEYNDAFIQKYFSDVASTTTEYEDSYRKACAETEFMDKMCNLVIDKATVNSVPKKYVNDMKTVVKAKDVALLNSVNSASYTYGDVLDMKKMTEEEYETYVASLAEVYAREALVVEALFDQFGLEMTDADINEFVEYYGYTEDYDGAVERFGEPYIKQQARKNALKNYLVTKIQLQ